ACRHAGASWASDGKGRPPHLGPHDRRFRRSRDAVFLPCGYDIRPIFEGRVGNAVERRDLMVAILIPPRSEEPTILEVPAPVFAWLVELDNWTDRAALAATAELDAPIFELAEHGLPEP